MGKEKSSIERTFKIRNRLGLHARAASKFVQVTDKFRSKISVKKDELIVDGKSIMGILILAAPFGTEITITANGVDAASALDAIGELIARRFDEENL